MGDDKSNIVQSKLILLDRELGELASSKMSDKDSKFLFYLTNLHILTCICCVFRVNINFFCGIGCLHASAERGHYCLIDKIDFAVFITILEVGMHGSQLLLT